MISIPNKLIDFRMVWFKTDTLTGTLPKIILKQCEKEAKRMKEDLKGECLEDPIVTFDYERAGNGVNILLYAFER